MCNQSIAKQGLSRSSDPMHRMQAICLLLLVLSGLTPALPAPAKASARVQNSGNPSNAVAPPTAQGPGFEVGKSVERELKGGESHAYTLTLQANQYLHVVVEQKGIDVVVRLFGLDGKQLLEVDSPNGTQGLEPVFWVAEAAGNYRLEVGSLEKEAQPGKYEALVKDVRASTEQDRTRIAILKIFTEGEQLRVQPSRVNYLKAIEKYQECLPLWRALDEKQKEGETLNNIGYILDTLGETKKALEYHIQALPLRRAVGDRLGEAITLNNMGVAYKALGENQKALESYAQALPLYKAVGDQAGAANTLNSMGVAYKALGEKQKALESYAQALPLFRALGDRGREGRTLNDIGRAYEALGEKQKALEHYIQALPLRKAVGDRSGEAATLNNIGFIYNALDEKQKALEYYAQALPLRKAVGDRDGEAITLTNIGIVYDALGEKQKALEYYAQALPLRKAVGDRDGEAITLNNMGLVYDALGEKQKALDYFAQALSLERTVGDRAKEAGILNNIGLVYEALGERQKALDYFAQALLLERVVGDRGGEAVTLNNMGLVYDALGDRQRALDYYAQALSLERTMADRAKEAGILNNIGMVYLALGERQKALNYFAQALPLERAVGDRRFEAITLNNLGRVNYELGEKQKALEYFVQALPLERAVGDRRVEAITLTNIGRVNYELGEKQKALDYYAQALLLERAVGDRFAEAITLFHTAKTLMDLGSLSEAKNRIEEALKLTEQARSSVADQELRASYLATVRSYYEFYIDLLLRMHREHPSVGYDKQALQVSESARARSLLELLNESRINIRQGADPQLLDRERSLKDRLNAKLENLTKLLNRKHTQEQETAAKKEIDALTDDYRQVQANIRRNSPRYAALTQPQPLTLEEIQQQVLASDTVLLEYSLGDEGSHLFAVTADTFNTYDLPQRKEIEQAARQVYGMLTARNQHPRGETLAERQARITQAEKDFPQSAAALSRMILGPVAGQLGRKRLLVAADGALQYIPFGALPVPPVQGSKLKVQSPEQLSPQSSVPRPLIVDHDVVSLPSASALAVLRKETAGRIPAEKTLAVLADPVFGGADDKRLKAPSAKAEGQPSAAKPEAQPLGATGEMMLGRMLERDESASGNEPVKLGFRIPRIPATRQEAEVILKLTEPSRSLKALDFAASRTTAINPDLGKYRYLHFATHGFLDSERPELSALVLSLMDENGQPQNGFLRGMEVYNLNLPAELVVLSACETGLGKEVKGEGLVGLTRGFMYAGAKRIVVSLWSVNDAATASLMTNLYRKMLREGQPPAAALRAAQLELLKSGKWSSPFYWAPFILQGEYR
ncbi:MAG: tetratricopeptide repeat protein [Blastocatellia bacterium]|nr:tetratricopeptide repeat protein [Blastocatellia bacterium]